MTCNQEIIIQGVRTTQVQFTPAGATVRIIQSSAPSPFGGAGGGGGAIVWSPPFAQSTWVIPHSLGRKPSVTIIDGNGYVVSADVQHLSDNVVSISFSVPVLGSAVLN